MSTGVVLTGDWRKLGALKASLLGTKKAIDQEIEMVAEDIAQEIRIMIDDGSHAVPNAESTIERKGFDDPLTETGKMSEEGIIVEHTKKDYKTYHVVKGSPSVRHPRTNETYATIVEILEYGAEGAGRNRNVSIPPRPTFHIAHDRIARTLPKKLIFKLREEYRRF